MNVFGGKSVLVTGASSGLGLAAARAFVAAGARVVITARDSRTLELARQEIGAGALVVPNDTARISAAGELARALTAQGIRLDAAFMNAGITRFAPFTDVTESLWDTTFDTNIKGMYFQIQALLPLFNQGASIVLNGSINAHIGAPMSSVYAASKAAVISLARTLSSELLPRGVRVNVISCGPIDTPLYGKLGLDQQSQASTIAQIRSQIPLGRFGRPEEVAATVVHLASPASSFIVGTEVIIDGGMSEL